MQHLHAGPKNDMFPRQSSAIQARVRFLAYHRIKPHVPPLVRAPVNSFEFHRCRRTPQVAHFYFRSTPDRVSPRASEHRLRRGLPGYLILFATHALAHQRQNEPGKLPSLSGFQVISMHFTATSLVPPPSSRLKVNSFNGVLQFSCSLLPLTCRPAYAPFKPNKSG